MKIGVIGYGNIGGTLGKKWAEAGHDVAFGVRDPQSQKVKDFMEQAPDSTEAVPVETAIQHGDVVLIAVPHGAVPSLMEMHGNSLNGKIVIDSTNDFSSQTTNNFAIITHHAPETRLYRAFNSLGWEIFEDSQFNEIPADHFYCGDNTEDRLIIEQLIDTLGMRSIRVGGVEAVHIVDALGSLWVTLAFQRGMGRQIALKLLKR